MVGNHSDIDLLVGFTKARKDIIMSVASINTVMLFYIGIMVFAIGVIILVYTGRIDNKRSKSSSR